MYLRDFKQTLPVMVKRYTFKLIKIQYHIQQHINMQTLEGPYFCRDIHDDVFLETILIEIHQVDETSLPVLSNYQRITATQL